MWTDEQMDNDRVTSGSGKHLIINEKNLIFIIRNTFFPGTKPYRKKIWGQIYFSKILNKNLNFMIGEPAPL